MDEPARSHRSARSRSGSAKSSRRSWAAIQLQVWPICSSSVSHGHQVCEETLPGLVAEVVRAAAQQPPDREEWVLASPAVPGALLLDAAAHVVHGSKAEPGDVERVQHPGHAQQAGAQRGRVAMKRVQRGDRDPLAPWSWLGGTHAEDKAFPASTSTVVIAKSWHGRLCLSTSLSLRNSGLGRRAPRGLQDDVSARLRTAGALRAQEFLPGDCFSGPPSVCLGRTQSMLQWVNAPLTIG